MKVKRKYRDESLPSPVTIVTSDSIANFSIKT